MLVVARVGVKIMCVEIKMTFLMLGDTLGLGEEEVKNLMYNG